MNERQYIADSGPMAGLSEDEKKKRLDAMVKIWQSDSERKLKHDGRAAFIEALGLNEYRYTVALRFPGVPHNFLQTGYSGRRKMVR